MTMNASASPLDGVNGRQQRMWDSGDDAAVATRIHPIVDEVGSDDWGIGGRALTTEDVKGNVGPRDMLVTSITVDPGGSFGWHTHPGPVLVAVSKGTLAVYQADGSRCPRSTLTAEEGSDPVELNAIFLARTGTKEFLSPVAPPTGCHV